jgi:hypothetical protein
MGNEPHVPWVVQQPRRRRGGEKKVGIDFHDHAPKDEDREHVGYEVDRQIDSGGSLQRSEQICLNCNAPAP